METPTLSVIIVDDEPAIRNGINNAIDWQSLSLVVTHLLKDGEEAYKTIVEEKPNIIITDLMMTGLTGLELIRKVRNSNIDSHFIILTGYDDFNLAKEAITLDVEDFLLKPLSKQELIDALKKVSSKIRSEKQRIRELHDLQSSAKLLLLNKLVAGEPIDNKSFDSIVDFKLDGDKETTTIVLQRNQPNSILSLEDFTSYIAQLKAEVFAYEKNYEICIVNASQASARHIARVFSEISTKQGYDYTFAIGSTVNSAKEITTSFQMGMLALSYQIYDKHRNIYDTDSIINTAPKYGSSDIDTSSLIKALYTQDNNSIKAWLKAFFSKLMYIPTPPPSYIKGMCIFLLTDINRQLWKEKHIESKFLPNIDYATINSLGTLEEIENWIEMIILNIAKVSIPEAELANDPIIYRSRKMVKDSLTFQISAQEVAERLNMNFTYFSSYYKQKTGENFSTYMIRLKNDYAKQLLADPQLSIEEISESLGYTDYRSFYRSFKKLNGVTPSSYRRTK